MVSERSWRLRKLQTPSSDHAPLWAPQEGAARVVGRGQEEAGELSWETKMQRSQGPGWEHTWGYRPGSGKGGKKGGRRGLGAPGPFIPVNN